MASITRAPKAAATGMGMRRMEMHGARLCLVAMHGPTCPTCMAQQHAWPNMHGILAVDVHRDVAVHRLAMSRVLRSLLAGRCEALGPDHPQLHGLKP